VFDELEFGLLVDEEDDFVVSAKVFIITHHRFNHEK
jgi:hypothetical protein